ncbi:hypothetical protein M0R72_17555 [Candidatus Pacearchaeota archaeon]|jgi:hypothetical protein|nr:hypothetical protein [Candidatus Pacearchaeota archaeon]
MSEPRDSILAKGIEVLQSDLPGKEWVAVIVGPDGACLAAADTRNELLRRLPVIPCAYMDEDGYCGNEDNIDCTRECPEIDDPRLCMDYEEAQ